VDKVTGASTGVDLSTAYDDGDVLEELSSIPCAHACIYGATAGRLQLAIPTGSDAAFPFQGTLWINRAAPVGAHHKNSPSLSRHADHAENTVWPKLNTKTTHPLAVRFPFRTEASTERHAQQATSEPSKGKAPEYITPPPWGSPFFQLRPPLKTQALSGEGHYRLARRTAVADQACHVAPAPPVAADRPQEGQGQRCQAFTLITLIARVLMLSRPRPGPPPR
jgi:hypothetical protein